MRSLVALHGPTTSAIGYSSKERRLYAAGLIQDKRGCILSMECSMLTSVLASARASQKDSMTGWFLPCTEPAICSDFSRHEMASAAPGHITR